MNRTKAELVGNPEDCGRKGITGHGIKHAAWRQLAIDRFRRLPWLAAQEYRIGGESLGRSGDDIDEEVLLGQDGRDGDQYCPCDGREADMTMHAIARQRADECIRDVQRRKTAVRLIEVVKQLQAPGRKAI